MPASKVSVIIPTYNYAHYLKYAVESVLAQTYPDLEVLVIDDGSTDGTQELMKPYLGKIRYFYKPNGGTPSALNFGISKSSGDYIAWLSADDVFFPEKIVRQVALMEQEQGAGFSYTSFAVIDGEGKYQYEIHSQYYPEKKELLSKLLEGCFINGSTVMMRRKALEQSGWFDESLPQAHDYELWFRMLRYYGCTFLDEILLSYRWHGANMSSRPNAACDAEVRRRAKMWFPWLA